MLLEEILEHFNFSVFNFQLLLNILERLIELLELGCDFLVLPSGDFSGLCFFFHKLSNSRILWGLLPYRCLMTILKYILYRSQPLIIFLKHCLFAYKRWLTAFYILRLDHFNLIEVGGVMKWAYLSTFISFIGSFTHFLDVVSFIYVHLCWWGRF